MHCHLGVIVTATLLALLALLCMLGTLVEVFRTYSKKSLTNNGEKKTTNGGIAVNEPTLVVECCEEDNTENTLGSPSFEEAKITRSKSKYFFKTSIDGGGEAVVIANDGVVNRSASCEQQQELSVGIAGTLVKGQTTQVSPKREENEQSTGGNKSESDIAGSQKSKKSNSCLEILECFSLLRNAKTIFSTDTRAGDIGCINGIRVISMTWVVIGHFVQHW